VTPLDEALQCVPSARVASTDALQAHLRALAPLLGAWLGAFRGLLASRRLARHALSPNLRPPPQPSRRL